MGHQGLSGVHGYGALRCHWKDYLSGMMRLPEQTVTKKAEYYRGGTKGNPFIQPKVVEYSSTVSPRTSTRPSVRFSSRSSSNSFFPFLIIFDCFLSLRSIPCEFFPFVMNECK
mgnify:CR=1 FL=1